MDAPEKYTLEQAHLKFAKQINGRVWTLMGQVQRTPDENDEMLHAAFASLYHWRFAGTVVNQQRGEWLLARAYTILGESDPALKHAQRCLDLTDTHRDQMQDFDIAFALGGKMDEAKQFYVRARVAGDQIADAEDKKVFDDDFNHGDMHGIQS